MMGPSPWVKSSRGINVVRHQGCPQEHGHRTTRIIPRNVPTESSDMDILALHTDSGSTSAVKRWQCEH